MSNHNLIENEKLRYRLDRLYSMCMRACDMRTSRGIKPSSERLRRINAYGAAIASLSAADSSVRTHVGRLLSLANNGIRG